MGLDQVEGGRRVSKGSDYEYIVKDIRKPERITKTRKDKVTAAIMQMVFGYVGGGYFYLEDNKKGLLAAVVFILGGALVVYMEMTIFPSATVINGSRMWLHYLALGLFGILAVVYLACVVECYRRGERNEILWRQKGGYEPQKARQLSPEEKIDKVFREHDERGGRTGGGGL